MNLRDHTNSLLQRIATEIPQGLAASGDFTLDQNDEFFLTLEDRIVIMFYLEEESSSLILNIPLGGVPEDDSRETVLLELLRANYSWNLTEGGTLGIDRETNLICLSYLVVLPLAEAAQIPVIISKLASVAQHWIRTLKEIQESAAEDNASEAPTAAMLRA